MCWPKGDSTVLFLILIKHPKMLLVMTLFLKCQLLKKRQCLWSKYQAAILSTSAQCCCRRWAGIPRGPDRSPSLQLFHGGILLLHAQLCCPGQGVSILQQPCPVQRQGADTPVNRSALSPNASLPLSLDSWNWPGSIEPCSFHGGMQFDRMKKVRSTLFCTVHNCCPLLSPRCKAVHLLFFLLLWALIIRRVVITFGLILCWIHFVAAVHKYPQF